MSYAARRKGDRLRVQGVGTPLPDDTECARLSRSTPSGFPQEDMRRHAIRSNSIWIPSGGHVACSPIRTPSGRSTRHSWTSHPDDNISYPDMLSGWKTLTKVSKPCYSPRSAALRWCVRTSFAGKTPYSLYFGFAYGKGLQSLGSSCF